MPASRDGERRALARKRRLAGEVSPSDSGASGETRADVPALGTRQPLDLLVCTQPARECAAQRDCSTGGWCSSYRVTEGGMVCTFWCEAAVRRATLCTNVCRRASSAWCVLLRSLVDCTLLVFPLPHVALAAACSHHDVAKFLAFALLPCRRRRPLALLRTARVAERRRVAARGCDTPRETRGTAGRPVVPASGTAWLCCWKPARRPVAWGHAWAPVAACRPHSRLREGHSAWREDEAAEVRVCLPAHPERLQSAL